MGDRMITPHGMNAYARCQYLGRASRVGFIRWTGNVGSHTLCKRSGRCLTWVELNRPQDWRQSKVATEGSAELAMSLNEEDHRFIQIPQKTQ